MIRLFEHSFEELVSIENLLDAWKEFVVGKRGRDDVQEFQVHLMTNLFSLHRDLIVGDYTHSSYQAFTVTDPKLRQIHKAFVRDRVLHHALYRKLYPYFDRRFIADSYSCRNGKGTHLAMNRFRDFARQASENHRRTCWVLKCDIRKFFASIEQRILLRILERYISDTRILGLLGIIINSYEELDYRVKPDNDNRGRRDDGKIQGLPLGNLTSQLLANIYMNEFDQFVKHVLRVEHYIRYADDFVFLHYEKQYLECLLPVIGDFLTSCLRLQLHPDKVFIKTFASGVDFLGWVHFPDHRVLRTTTQHRMFRNMGDSPSREQIASYLGLCSHGQTEILVSTFPAVARR